MTTCPICNTKNTEKFLNASNTHGGVVINKKEKFIYNKCPNCDALFATDVKVNKEYYKKYYENYTEGKDSVHSLITKLNNYSISKRESLILNSVIKNKLNILDIGSGDCQFLLNISAKKFDKTAVEISTESNSIAKENNITVINKDIFDINFNNKKFDVITLWHVIEHIENPQKLINKLTKLLSKNGIICISTPNTNSFGFKYGKTDWFHLDAPRHLILFNNKTIKVLAENNSMTVTKTVNENYTFPTDLLRSIRNNSAKYLFYIFYPILKFIDTEATIYVLRNK